MNVDAFPPVRSMETSGSGCGYTCCEEIILQKDTVKASGPSSSALAQQSRQDGLPHLPGSAAATVGLGQPVPGAFPPASHGMYSRLQKVTESGLFPKALLFQHYTVLRETSKLERLWRDCGVFMLFSLICDNPLPWAVGDSELPSPADGPWPCGLGKGQRLWPGRLFPPLCAGCRAGAWWCFFQTP